MSWTIKNADGEELAKVLNFTPALDRAKILTRLYDGSYLAQTVGQPSKRPALNILVESMDALRAVEAAEAGCALLTVTYQDTEYIGYLVDAPKWTPVIRGRVYTAPVNFAVMEEAPVS